MNDDVFKVLDSEGTLGPATFDFGANGQTCYRIQIQSGTCTCSAEAYEGDDLPSEIKQQGEMTRGSFKTVTAEVGLLLAYYR